MSAHETRAETTRDRSRDTGHAPESRGGVVCEGVMSAHETRAETTRDRSRDTGHTPESRGGIVVREWSEVAIRVIIITCGDLAVTADTPEDRV